MNIKKIVAAVSAAAMAASAVAVTPLFVSADTTITYAPAVTDVAPAIYSQNSSWGGWAASDWTTFSALDTGVELSLPVSSYINNNSDGNGFLGIQVQINNENWADGETAGIYYEITAASITDDEDTTTQLSSLVTTYGGVQTYVVHDNPDNKWSEGKEWQTSIKSAVDDVIGENTENYNDTATINITIKLTGIDEVPSTDDEEEEDTRSDYALLYNKEFNVTTAYEGEQIPVTAAEGDKITVTYKLNDAGEYHQLSFKHAGEDWPALTSPEYTSKEWSVVDVSTDGTFTFTLNAEDAKNITANNLVISGYSVTYTKVELNADKNTSGGEGEDIDDDVDDDDDVEEDITDSGITSGTNLIGDKTIEMISVPVTAPEAKEEVVSVSTAAEAVNTISSAKSNSAINVTGEAAEAGLTPEMAEALANGKPNVIVRFKTASATVIVNSNDVASADAKVDLKIDVEVSDDSAEIVIDGEFSDVEKAYANIKLPSLNGKKVVVKAGGKVIAKRYVTANYLYIPVTPDIIGETITVTVAE